MVLKFQLHGVGDISERNQNKIMRHGWTDPYLSSFASMTRVSPLKFARTLTHTYIQMLLGTVGLVAAVHFTKPAGARGAPSPRRLLGQTSAVGNPDVSPRGSRTKWFLLPRATNAFEEKSDRERQWVKKEDYPIPVGSNRGALATKVIPMVSELLEG